MWTLAWHPIGHILCSGSNDHTVKFWTRNRPGDQMRDKYNLNTLPAALAGLEDYEMDEHIVIPGMGIEEDNEYEPEMPSINEQQSNLIDIQESNSNSESAVIDIGIIPGLDLDASVRDKKLPYTKPIPKNFQAQWNVSVRSSTKNVETIQSVISKVNERMPNVIRNDDLRSDRVFIYGKEIDVRRMLILFYF